MLQTLGALAVRRLAGILASHEVAKQRRGIGIDALADAKDVVALEQAIDALLGRVGIAAVELGREPRDLELLAAEVRGNAKRQLVGTRCVEVVVLEGLCVERVLNAPAVLVYSLEVCVEVRGVCCVP